MMANDLSNVSVPADITSRTLIGIVCLKVTRCYRVPENEGTLPKMSVIPKCLKPYFVKALKINLHLFYLVFKDKTIKTHYPDNSGPYCWLLAPKHWKSDIWYFHVRLKRNLGFRCKHERYMKKVFSRFWIVSFFPAEDFLMFYPLKKHNLIHKAHVLFVL